MCCKCDEIKPATFIYRFKKANEYIFTYRVIFKVLIKNISGLLKSSLDETETEIQVKS